MAFGRWDAAGRAIRRVELDWIEPLHVAATKHRRLALFGIAQVGDLGCADLDLLPAGGDCLSNCLDFVAGERRYLSKYLFRDTHRKALFRCVPCVIDLDRYPDVDRYLARVRRHSKGGILRQVRRARADGFFCKTIHSDLYRRQRFDIDTSKWFRSGLMLATLLRTPPPSEFAIAPAELAAYLGRPPSEIVPGMALPEPPPPACLLHWHIDWGVFTREGADDRHAQDGDRQDGACERLVGYLFLKRTGNLVQTTGFMGHGGYLSRHIMKLLFHDVMTWLLARQDPRVRGLRYLLYGALEHGNAGLLAWKRGFEFAPMRFGYSGAGSLDGESQVGSMVSSGQTGRRTLSNSSGV